MISSNNSAQGANAQLGSTSMTTNSPATYLGSICCFIFLEAYHGNIPSHVRKYRDKVYNKNHDIATGYRRMAKWLVPSMQRFSLVRFLVWYLMVLPITKNCTSNKKMSKARIITHFWLRVWAILGKGHNENEYAMQWRYTGVRTA